MKTLNKMLFALVATSAVAVSANAAVFQNSGTGQPYAGIKGGVYNVSLNPVFIDGKEAKDSNDNPTAFGLFGGYQYDANWGVEGEYLRSGEADYSYTASSDKVPVYTEVPAVAAVTDASGKVTTPASPARVDTTYETNKIGAAGNIKGETLGLYGTYKYDFPNTAIYAKGKLGIAQNKLEFDVPTARALNSKSQVVSVGGTQWKQSIKESGLAGGVGVGYNVSPAIAVEAEYSTLPKIEESSSDLITIGAKAKF